MPLTENQEFYRVWRVDTGRQAAQLETFPRPGSIWGDGH
jgi:hypothetical protein